MFHRPVFVWVFGCEFSRFGMVQFGSVESSLYELLGELVFVVLCVEIVD